MNRIVLRRMAVLPAALACLAAGAAVAAAPQAHTVMMSDTVMSLVTAIEGGTDRYRPALIDDFDVADLAAPVATSRAMVAFDCGTPRKIAYIEGLRNRSRQAGVGPDWASTRFAGDANGVPAFDALPYVVLSDWVREAASRHGTAALPAVDALAGEVVCGGARDPAKEAAIATEMRISGGFAGLTALTCSGKLPAQGGAGIRMHVRYSTAAGALQADEQWISRPLFAGEAISFVRDGVTISVNTRTRDVVWGLASQKFVAGKCTVGIEDARPKS